MVRQKAILVFLIACLTISLASAETRLNLIGLEVTIPGSWLVEGREDEFFCSEPDESAAVLILASDAEDLEDAWRFVYEELNDWLDNVQPNSKYEKGSINGLPTTFLEGTASADGHPVNWLVTYIYYRDEILIIAAWGERGEWNPEVGDVVDILRSVQPEPY
jgi:hypothetical protein